MALKYLMASQTLSGTTFDKGANPYQDFATLVNLRNDLMHLKPRDTFLEPGNGQTLTIQPPKYIRALQQRGLAHTPPEMVNISWFHMIQKDAMAGWACATAENIILAVLKMIPDDEGYARDPAAGLKNLFRAKC